MWITAALASGEEGQDGRVPGANQKPVLQGVDFRDFPCPKLTVNFPMELSDPRGPGEGEGGCSEVGHAAFNGATRMCASPVARGCLRVATAAAAAENISAQDPWHAALA